MAKATVLVVDSQADARDEVAASLRSAGFGVLMASSGVEAVDHARQHRPAVIVADISISDMDGIETVRCLKADPELRRIPVIACTDRWDTGDPSAFYAVCVKPCPAEVLVSMVQDAASCPDRPPILTLSLVRDQATALRERALTLNRAFTRTSTKRRLDAAIAAIDRRLEELKGVQAGPLPADYVAGYLAQPALEISELETLLRVRGPDAEGSH